MELVPHGYIRAEFEVRGTGGSGGVFTLWGAREQEDYAELVHWLADLPRSTGKIGMYGISYMGISQYFAARAAGPDSPIEALVPIVTGVDVYRDVFFNGGLWNEIFNDVFFGGFSGAAHTLSPVLAQDDMSAEEVVDTTQAHLAGVLQTEAQILGANVGTEQAYREDYWRTRSWEYALPKVVEYDIPVFNFAGWYDLYQGPLVYKQLQNLWAGRDQFSPMVPNQPVSGRYQAVIGNYYHGGTSDNNHHLAKLWFDRFLKGIETGVTDLPRVDTQVSTGERLQHEEMPPEGTTVTRFELTRSEQTERSLALQGTLPVYADQKPPATEAQMFATDGSDAGHLKFESAPLSGPLRITGSVPFDDTWRAPLLEVIASVSDDSVQFTPVLYERFPDGSTDVITRGFLNARKRDGLDADEPVPTDEPFVAPTQLWDTDYVLGEGSRLGLVVASDNREWCLDDPDGESVTEIILGAPDSGGGTSLHLPVAAAPDGLDVPDVTGTREDDASVFTGGQTDEIDISVEAADESVEIRDTVPDGWSVYEASDDVERVEKPDDGPNYVYFSPEGETVEVTYFAEAPSGAAETGQYTFGPVEARAGESNWVAVEGTSDTNIVVGPEQP